MKICGNGHSYDDTQFNTCPICYSMGLTDPAAGGAADAVQQAAAGAYGDAQSVQNAAAEIVRDENGGYYDTEGNYIDAAGNKYFPAPQGGFYDTQGGYYDVSGNYYPPASAQPAAPAQPAYTEPAQPVQPAAPAQSVYTEAAASTQAVQPAPTTQPGSPAITYQTAPEQQAASAQTAYTAQAAAPEYTTQPASAQPAYTAQPASAQPAYGAVPPQGSVPPEGKAKKKGGKKKIIIIAIIAVLLLAGAAVWFFFLRDSEKKGKDDEGRPTMTRNDETFLLNSYSSKTNSIIPPGFLMFSSDAKNISFLYNDIYTVSDEKGATYINLSADGSEYIEVKYKSGKTSPKEYFKKYKSALKKEYGSDSTISDILETPLINNPDTGVYKNAYCVSAEVDDNGRTLYIDRYLMIYEKNYVEVSAYTYTAKAADEPAYRICSSFYTRANGFDPYEGGDDGTTEVVDNPTTEVPTTEVPTTEATTATPTTEATTQATTEYTTQATTENTTQYTTEATTTSTGGTETCQGTGVTVIFPEGTCPNGWEATQTGLNLYVLPDTKDIYIAIEYCSYGPANIQQCVTDIITMFQQNLGAEATIRDQETVQGAKYTFSYAPAVLTNSQGSVKVVGAAVQSESGKIYAIYFMTDDAHESYFLNAFTILVDNIYLD